MKTAILALLSVGVISAISGCALRSQLEYEPERMSAYVGEAGRVLKVHEPLQKKDVTQMLAGHGTQGLDPDQFELTPNAIDAIFDPGTVDGFSFVVAADAQMEDRGTRFGRRLTHFLDKRERIETTVRGFYQDHADEFYLGFLLKAIRLGLEANTNIDFVIHLGDALQTGRRSELESFNAMIGKFLIGGRAQAWETAWTGTWLQTPIQLPGGREAGFYNLLGNHDLFILGNFKGNFPIRVPGGGISGFAGLNSALAQTPPFGGREGSQGTNCLGEGTASRGYYLVDRVMPEGKKARLIVLSTSEGTLLDPLIPKLQRAALYPSLSSGQFDWLCASLSEAQMDPSIGVVLVFGHYPLMQITVNRTGRRSDRDGSFGEVEQVLAHFSKVSAYFCGHLHSGSPPKEHRAGDHVFDEYICPSLQEFPKSFGLASVNKHPVTGKYVTQVRYFNLEDLIDCDQLPNLEVSEDGPPRDQQTLLVHWLAQLANCATNAMERNKLLARYCYASSSYDIQHDLRQNISLCFHPKFTRQLLQQYSTAQDFWLELKRQPLWGNVRFALEQPEGWLPFARVSGGSEPAQRWGEQTRPLLPESIRPADSSGQ